MLRGQCGLIILIDKFIKKHGKEYKADDVDVRININPKCRDEKEGTYWAELTARGKNGRVDHHLWTIETWGFDVSSIKSPVSFEDPGAKPLKEFGSKGVEVSLKYLEILVERGDHYLNTICALIQTDEFEDRNRIL